MIVAYGLTKRYGSTRLRSIRSPVLSGSAGLGHRLPGPTGAGKSTTMRSCSTSTTGQARRGSTAAGSATSGTPCARSARCSRPSLPPDPLGAQPSANAGRGQLHRHLSGGRGLGVGRAGRGRPKRPRVSPGCRSGSGSAAALLGDPHTLILDEPANGLDPHGIQWLRDLLKLLESQGRADFRLQPPPHGDGTDG